MTEDDTFRVLARPSVEEMVKLHREHYREWCSNSEVYPASQCVIFAKHHGWGWLEYLIARKASGLSYY